MALFPAMIYPVSPHTISIRVRFLIHDIVHKIKDMTNQKQFGVWMDTHHATVVGNENAGTGG